MSASNPWCCGPVRSEQDFRPGPVVEADQGRGAGPDAGSAQVAGGAEEEIQHAFVDRAIGGEVVSRRPLATITRDEASRMERASSRCSFFEAETFSSGSMPFASMNLDALPQLVHPLR